MSDVDDELDDEVEDGAITMLDTDDDIYSLDEDEPSNDLAYSVFRKVFRDLDTDGSGALSRREVRAALSSLGLPSTPEFLEPMFTDCDVDKNGVIRFEEFMAYAVRREAELRTVFDDLDSNCDGIIDEHDIRSGLRRLGLRASDEKIASLIQKMDQTNNGIITFVEFQTFLMLLPNQSLDETFQTWAKSSRIDLGENMQVPDELSTMSAGDALITFAAGAAAGAVSRTATAPMDRLKVLLQAGPTGGSFTVRMATGPESTILGGLRTIYGEGGMWAFFRGNGTNVLKIMPESAVKFFAYDFSRNESPRMQAIFRFTAIYCGGSRVRVADSDLPVGNSQDKAGVGSEGRIPWNHALSAEDDRSRWAACDLCRVRGIVLRHHSILRYRPVCVHDAEAALAQQPPSSR